MGEIKVRSFRILWQQQQLAEHFPTTVITYISWQQVSKSTKYKKAGIHQFKKNLSLKVK